MVKDRPRQESTIPFTIPLHNPPDALQAAPSQPQIAAPLPYGCPPCQTTPMTPLLACLHACTDPMVAVATLLPHVCERAGGGWMPTGGTVASWIPIRWPPGSSNAMFTPSCGIHRSLLPTCSPTSSATTCTKGMHRHPLPRTAHPRTDRAGPCRPRQARGGTRALPSGHLRDGNGPAVRLGPHFRCPDGGGVRGRDGHGREARQRNRPTSRGRVVPVVPQVLPDRHLRHQGRAPSQERFVAAHGRAGHPPTPAPIRNVLRRQGRGRAPCPDAS